MSLQRKYKQPHSTVQWPQFRCQLISGELGLRDLPLQASCWQCCYLLLPRDLPGGTTVPAVLPASPPPQWIFGQISRVSALQTKSFVLTISLSVGVPHLSNDVVMCPPVLPRSPQAELKVGGGIFTHLSKQVASPARCHVPDPPQRLALLLSCCCLRTGAGLEWCPIMCSSPPFPSIWNSLGFFPLTSIAYRRVIRVYQYEVGDDLSGRFILLIFLNSLCSLVVFFPNGALLIPTLAFLFVCYCPQGAFWRGESVFSRRSAHS